MQRLKLASVDDLSVIDKGKFQTDYFQPLRPLVIRGLAAGWPAEALVASLRAIADHSFDSIMITRAGKESPILYVNKAFTALTGYSAKSMMAGREGIGVPWCGALVGRGRRAGIPAGW
jgi:PAS domain-containing protein